MASIKTLAEQLNSFFGDKLKSCSVDCKEVTIEIAAADIQEVCLALRDQESFRFEILIDVCGVDYLDYGVSEWETRSVSTDGFCRGVEKQTEENTLSQHRRFAVAYHLLSIQNNHRLRVKAFAEGEPPTVTSVYEIWNSANWFEREAFDLYGIVFVGHPDMRRILTDYGFIGHPFRKDFPLSGHVEMRYDEEQKRVVYEPVTIEPRVLVPKVIREDNRYFHEQEKKAEGAANG